MKEMTVTELARMGGHARAKSLSPKRRKEIASNAVKVRHAKERAQKKK